MTASESESFISAEKLSWNDLGGNVQRKILGFDGQLMMVHVQFKKDSIGSLHQHPHRQVTFVKRGSFTVEIDGVKNFLKEGDSFFVAPNLLHGCVALEDGELIDIFTPVREDFITKG